jgi:signal transduction histidine kinase
LAHVFRALEKIKLATKAPDEVVETVSLCRLWDEACTAVGGRLHAQGIEVRRSEQDLTIQGVQDRLRQVFLNLLLNSIDAFGPAKKRGRRIDLSIDRPADRSNHIQLTYRDNATGLNPQRLRGPSEFDDLPAEQRIFAPGVTSKATGSGYGLWLVRQILDDHQGSIDLVDYRGGVTFVVRLPKLSDVNPRQGVE